MAQPKHVVCPSCGFKNSLPLQNNRCVSCGAKIEDLKRVLSRQEEIERRYQQEGFSPSWFGIAFVIVSVLTAAIVMGLPMVIPLFDFEGSAGMLMSIPVWFLAGVLVGLVLDSPEGKVVRVRLEGIGFGFLVPVYFVVTGMTFDIDSLLTVEGLSLAAIFLALLLVTRGASAFLWLRELGPRGTASLALFGATGLPLIVAIVGIGSERGDVSKSVGASLIGAGMISVLVYPFIASRLAAPYADEDAPLETVESLEY